MTELEVLIEQLDELITGDIEDAEDAMEIAVVAGLADRLGATPEQLAEAVAWRDGAGGAFLDEAWRDVDLDGVLEALDACTGGDVDPEDVEEILFDLDDVIAAAVWCGREANVRKAARDAAATVRSVPEPFAPFAADAREVMSLRSVGERYDLYDFWAAVIEAEPWLDEH